MATARKNDVKELVFEWEGRDRNGKTVRGETRAISENVVGITLRRQGITPLKIKKRRMLSGKKIRPKDIAIFTRQLATMMKAGVPLLQAFDIVGRGNPNPSVSRLLNEVRSDVETGTSLSTAFRKHPLYFNALYCNLVEAGEAAGILEELLDRLAVYMEKTEAIKSKVKSALMYPTAVVVVAFIVVTVIMIFVIPAFKEVFSSFGADLPAPTLFVIAMSEFFVAYWWLLFSVVGGGVYFFFQAWQRNAQVQRVMDRVLLKIPVFGTLVEKSTVARWTRTLATMFAAGVPLVEALDSVGGASGNTLYADATEKIQQEVSTGTSLTMAMTNANLFPAMVLQMCAIGEEAGSIDHMLGKAADFYEQEVDDMVAGLSSL
ncbi:MAG: type II secretion system F family protein, partial [Macromonas sp.]